MKTVFAPHLNREVAFGRKIPVVVGPHLKLRNYLRASMPTPPVALDLSGPAMTCLRNVEQNDALGDCVIAAKTHVDGIWTGNAGSLVSASSAQVLAQYEAIGGYKPGDPSTDQGCNMQTALNWWTQNTGPTGNKLTAWLGVDATNVLELKTALYLFENLFFGIALPDRWVTPFPSGDDFVWDVAGNADPNNGHCIPGYGYTVDSVRIVSWGLLGLLTYKAIASYAVASSGGELYVALSTDMLIKGQQKAPNGVDWASLISDWDGIGGALPVPAPAPSPAPAPAPAPAPGGTMTLAQAQALVNAGIGANPTNLMTKSLAQSLAMSALAKGWTT